MTLSAADLRALAALLEDAAQRGAERALAALPARGRGRQPAAESESSAEPVLSELDMARARESIASAKARRRRR